MNWTAFVITAALVAVVLCIAFVAGLTKALKDAVLREEAERLERKREAYEVLDTDESGSGNYW